MQNLKDELGRKGLFSVIVKDEEPQVKHYTEEELVGIIDSLLTDNYDNLSEIPPFLTPIIQKLQSKSEKILKNESGIEKISKEYDVLRSELDFTRKELENLSKDMITAQTTLDRALEIFQYNTIPMVVLDEENRILDLNYAFCTLFSLVRSEVISGNIPISTYIPVDVSFNGPDGILYTKFSVSPPVIPCGQEAFSLELFINIPEQEERKPVSFLSFELISSILDRLPFGIGIIDEYNIVKYVNPTLISLLNREYNEIKYRDISSTGFSSDITSLIIKVNETQQASEIGTKVALRNGTEINVWIHAVVVGFDEETCILLIVLPDEEKEEVASEGKDIEKLKEGNIQILKTLIDINPSPVILLDSERSIILANEGISELIGVSSDQLEGQKLSDIGINIPILTSGCESIEVLPDKLSIESPYGIQEFSAILLNNVSDGVKQSLLILNSAIGNVTDTLDDLKNIETHEVTELVSSASYELNVSASHVSDSGIGMDSNNPILCPIPAISIIEGELKQINKEFFQWTGVEDEILPELSSTLVSNLVQSKRYPDQVFSSLFPAGMRYYRIHFVPNQNTSNTGKGYFIDLSDAYKKISALETESETLKREISETRDRISTDTHKDIFTDERGAQIDIVEFDLSGGRYAMDIGMVREVVDMLPITPIPKTPPYIIGIINLRGEVTHIIDLGILLGEGLKKDRSGQKIIIIPTDAAHGEHLGIIVDNVRSVTEIGVKQVTSLGDEINARIQTTIKGVIKITHDELNEKHEDDKKGDNLVIWLDMKDILNRLAGHR